MPAWDQIIHSYCAVSYYTVAMGKLLPDKSAKKKLETFSQLWQ